MPVHRPGAGCRSGAGGGDVGVVADGGDLFQPFELDRHNEHAPGDPPTVQITPATWDGDTLRTFWHSDYLRSATRHDELDERRHLLRLWLSLD